MKPGPFSLASIRRSAWKAFLRSCVISCNDGIMVSVERRPADRPGGRKEACSRVRKDIYAGGFPRTHRRGTTSSKGERPTAAPATGGLRGDGRPRRPAEWQDARDNLLGERGSA